jgi:hypothetical protein
MLIAIFVFICELMYAFYLAFFLLETVLRAIKGLLHGALSWEQGKNLECDSNDSVTSNQEVP